LRNAQKYVMGGAQEITMTKPHVLIVGASIAGPATAFWLVRAGFKVTIVELATSLREGGNGVDIREQALAVTERMGLLNGVREKAIHSAGMRFVDRHDRVTARLAMGSMHEAIGTEDIEISRGDLAQILFCATRDHVDYRFGDSIAAIEQDAAGVNVRFEHGAEERFDLVVGADGLHSRVRRLAFGAEAEFLSFKQYYFAAATADLDLGERGWSTFYNVPGKSVAIFRPTAGRSHINFMFHTPQPIAYDYRDTRAQRLILQEAFAGLGWHVPELLAEMEASRDFYFDSISQVKMPSWSTGRVTLVGDAAACASPASGAGALLSLIGAYRLAGELASGDDLADGLQRYETAHRPLVAAKQAALFTAISVPRRHIGIWARNLLVASPLLSLVSGFGSRPAGPLLDYDFRSGVVI